MLKTDAKKIVDEELKQFMATTPETQQSDTGITAQGMMQEGAQGILDQPLGAFEADAEFNPTADDIIKVKKPGEDVREALKVAKQPYEEAVIDELLMSVPRAQGYYLKLAKEIRPNEFELKLRIDNYEQWSDLEWEITKLVRDYTKKEPAKWGTGKYRVIVWHEKGIRGQKRPPMDFFVDAQEGMYATQAANAVNPEKVLETQLDSLSRFTETLHKINPPQQNLNPSDILNIAAQSMQKGQELAASKASGESSAVAAMMQAMMQSMQQNTQMMIAMMQQQSQRKEMDPLTMLLIKDMMENREGKKNALSMIKELKDAGLIPERKEQGLSGEIQNLIQMKELVEMFGGGGEGGEGGVLESIVKTLGPKVPEIIGNVTSTINKVVDFNKQKLALMNGQRPQQPALANPPKEAPTGLDENQSMEAKKEAMIKVFATKLHNYVVNKNYDGFEEITKTIKMFTGGAPIFEDAIKQGTMSSTDLVKFVTDYDKEHYQTEAEMDLLKEYCAEYVNHIKEQGSLVHVKCEKCGSEYNYDSKEDFEADVNEGAKCEECQEGNLVLAGA